MNTVQNLSSFDGLKMIRSNLLAVDLYGLQVLMVETSIAITAAAILSPLVDYADLDGNILTSNDPFDGVKVVDGMLVLPEGSGLGVNLKE